MQFHPQHLVSIRINVQKFKDATSEKHCHVWSLPMFTHLLSQHSWESNYEIKYAYLINLY